MTDKLKPEDIVNILGERMLALQNATPEELRSKSTRREFAHAIDLPTDVYSLVVDGLTEVAFGMLRKASLSDVLLTAVIGSLDLGHAIAKAQRERENAAEGGR